MSRRSADAALTRIGQTGVEILESLGQHRLLSTRQVHDLHTPRTSFRWTRYLLGRLRTAGFAEAVAGPGGLLLWYVSEEGADGLEAIPSRAESRRPAVTPAKAAGPLQQHTLAVNDVGLAFVVAARARADECGAFDWFHEVAHPLGPPPGRRAPEQLIADAVLTYQLAEEDADTFSVVYRFVELDRANRSAAELARRIGRYSRLFHREIDQEGGGGRVALWELLYPVFPGVLVVLAGRERSRLVERRKAALALCQADPSLAGTPEVEVKLCLAEDLGCGGPFSPIFRSPRQPDTDLDWLAEDGET